ncbi:MAG TPA: hypothetical protein VEU30_08870 [Thermoanaerobaculia bacterium]|nr:hypothetical protein [Thermoanaerobaculia bacterium]
MTSARRELFLSAAFALWGLAIAIALASVWDQPAPAGQLPSHATRFNFDAHAPFRWWIGMMLLPIVTPLVLRPVSRRLAQGQRWAFGAAALTPLVALWFVIITRDPWWAILPFAAVIATCTLLRHRDLRFTRHDVVLVPVLLMTVLAVNDAFTSLSIDRTLVLAALLVFATRVAVALIPSPLPPALAFVAAPVGLLLQTSFFARDQRYFGWHALTFAVITPLLLRVFVKNARRAIAMLVFVSYPLALAAYLNATSIQTAEGKPRVNVFEDSHSLLPASEMLAGELPYRDFIPAHGLIEDGLFDYLAMQARGVSVGAMWKSRLTLGMFNAVALYALAWAVTGSPHAAFLAVLLACLTNMYTPAIRLLPPMITLALICGALRLRRLQWLRYAAIGTVACGATSLDFGFYTFVTFLIAVWRFPGPRRETLRAAATGLAIAAVPFFAGLAFLGILDDFFRTTFLEVPALGPVYTLSMFDPHPALARTFPEVLAAVFDRNGFLYILWCVAVIFTGVTLTRRPRRRIEPLVLVAFWITLTAISYAERHHLYFAMAAAPFAIGLVWLVRRHRLAPLFILGFLILAAPTTHIGVVGWIRDARGPVEPKFVEVPEIPRARGALFLDEDAEALRGVARYASLALGPDETWLDLTNRGIFYFLLRRDCPIREAEVAYYQSEERQREVIRRLETDPRIVAVLVPGPKNRYTVDAILNQDRVPLVWAYVQEHFAPDFAEGDVVMWRRR